MSIEGRLALGIDTGGTYTDAVLLEGATGNVVATAKALTTYGDLSVGISEAIQGLEPFDSDEVSLVSLSTTLATNAIVEGRGRPACLILLGYDAQLVRDKGFLDDLGTDDVVFCEGGHDPNGNEAHPLDLEAVRQAALRHREDVDAYAISGYFSVRNPEHELRAKAAIEESTGLPVTCGHELSSKLNSIKRATTAALNARLIPLLRELMSAVQHTLDALEIGAPLMVVKGDGSLVAADVALTKPVETILSGPAASAVGGRYLCGTDDVVVVDMGGTTTDIAVLIGEQPRLNAAGASVGQWQTMVEAVDVRTVGLGGDSQVSVNREGGVDIGPRRVVSLSRVASEHPHVLEALRRQARAKRLHVEAGVFICPNGAMPDDLPSELAGLRNGPIAFQDPLQLSGYPYAIRNQVEALERRGLVTRAGFTPTDALHVTGDYLLWSKEAADLAASLLARRLGWTAQRLAERVVDQVGQQAAREILAKTIIDVIGPVGWPGDELTEYIVGQSLNHHDEDPIVSYHLRMKRPLVAIGAPVGAYFPEVARQLHGELVIPEHAGVANAVGAVAGSIVQRVSLIIRPLEDYGYRLHDADGIHDFTELENAAQAGISHASALAERRAVEAGARTVELRVEREDQVVSPADRVEEIYLGSTIQVTAIGRLLPLPTA
jgi:N-methylhydantoinase A/oxoprolinase/acetone carboxylase beta subunit